MGSLTRPRSLVPPEGGRSVPEVQLLQSLVLFLLVADVLAYHLLIPPDGRNEVTPGPEVLAHEITFALAVDASQMDRTLAFDEAHNLRNRVLRGGWRSSYAHDPASSGPLRSYFPSVSPTF